ncbi:MAG: restriction endonuclease subunit S [Actinomycetota bacterium]
MKERVDADSADVERYVAGSHMDTDDLRIRRWGLIGDDYLGPAFHILFKPGQVLYGSRRTYLRKVAVPDFEGICANTTFVVEASTGELLQEFLPLVMSTERFHEHSTQQSKGSVNPYINFSDLEWYEFPLPTVSEQRSILELIAEFDLVAERLRGARHSATDLLRSLGKTIDSDESVRLDSLAGIQLGRQRSPKYEEGVRPLPYLRAANLKMDHVDWSDVKEMDFTHEEEEVYGLQPGDILLVEGGDPDKVGAPTWFEGADSPVCMQNTVVRVRVTSPEVHPRFLYWALRSAFEAGEFERVATGTKLYHLGLKKLRPFEIPLLDPATQKDLADKADACQHVGLMIESDLSAVSSARRALLNSLLRGETRV